MAARYDIAIRRGDAYTLPMRLYTPSGAARSLLGGTTITAVVKEGPTAEADDAPVQFVATITNAARGLAQIAMAQTGSLPEGTYYYEVDVVQAGEREGLLYGQINVTEGLI